MEPLLEKMIHFLYDVGYKDICPIKNRLVRYVKKEGSTEKHVICCAFYMDGKYVTVINDKFKDKRYKDILSKKHDIEEIEEYMIIKKKIKKN